MYHYTPPTAQQQTAQQQQQQQQRQQSQQSGLSAQTGPGNIPANIDKNIIFANSDRLAQQYNLHNAGAPSQTTFSALHDDPSNHGQAVTDPNLAQSPEDGEDKQNASQSNSNSRVLASSKRAAQNRAAQRAFRQRKDRYIKSLEQKATDYDLSHSIIADLRKENIYLRDYVVRLQNEVDSLNTELGRAPMFASPPTQRNPQQNQNQQQSSLPVSLSQNYPIQIDPQTAAAAAAAAANVQSQDNQSGLTRLAPAESTHNAMAMPAGDPPMVEQKPEETTTQPKPKTNRSRKRKNETQAEGQ
jgi:hypothetical protein